LNPESVQKENGKDTWTWQAVLNRHHALDACKRILF